MATPKKRTSPVRSGNRRRNIGLTLPATEVCPACASVKVKHHVCIVCGQYKGREVIKREMPAVSKRK